MSNLAVRKSLAPWGVMKVKKLATGQTRLYVVECGQTSLDDPDHKPPLAEVLSNEEDANMMAAASTLIQTMEYVSGVLQQLDTPFQRHEEALQRCVMLLNDAIKVAKEGRE